VVRLSDKHGVNPSMLVCCVCGEGTAVALLGQLPSDREAPRKMIDPSGPCSDCNATMTKQREQGFMLLVVDDMFEEAMQEWNLLSEYMKTRKMKPTEWMFFLGYHVITHEACDRIFNEGVDRSKGAAFISQKVADYIGLPKQSSD